MKDQVLSSLVLASIAGVAMAGGDMPTKLDPTPGQLKHVAHIYFNVATGEKITTLMQSGDVQQPSEGDSSDEIWVQTTGAMCIDFGDTTSFFYEMDDPSDTSTLHQMLFDWGDIAFDTVVDCVQIHWVTNHQDSDDDSDQLADGVVGFQGSWTYWDGMNGRSPWFACIASPLITFEFHNLPGELSDPSDSSLAFYTADIDLGDTGAFGTSVIFELGDSDSDLQKAVVHNHMIVNLPFPEVGIPGATWGDPDADGLADWGWSLIYDQPGTVDVDNADGDSDETTGIDGDPLALAAAGVAFGAPTPGHPEFDSIGMTWSWVSDGLTAGLAEDVFNTARIVGSSIILDGPWFFGGLNCTPDEAGYIPAAMFQTVLYGPGNAVCCCPDLNGDGALDFFDISFFLTNLVDYNEDTVFDFFDISNFLSDFGAGCP